MKDWFPTLKKRSKEKWRESWNGLLGAKKKCCKQKRASQSGKNLP
jgi:hypothetical protein